MNQGAWVTLHFVQPMPLENNGSVHHLTGFLETDPRLSGYRLTKMVTEEQCPHPSRPMGFATNKTIHHGTWLIAPQFVWMVEYEKVAPTEGIAL